MRISHYIKMAVRLARTEKVYTGLYIGGVAIAVAMTMILSTVIYVKSGPIYPEHNRNNTAYINVVGRVKTDNSSSSWWGVDRRLLEDQIYNLKNKEDIGVYIDQWPSDHYLQPGAGKPDADVLLRPCDDGFFRIYEFDVLAGRVLAPDDLKTDRKIVIITDRLARNLFGSPEDAVGKDVSIDFLKFNVIGVVKSASSLTRRSFADVYMPYTAFGGADGFNVIFKIKDEEQINALRAELEEVTRTYEPEPDMKLDFKSQPYNHIADVFDDFHENVDMTWWDALKNYLALVIVLLFVPALNLSGMITGRMESRISETGIRKAFGAPRHSLVAQVLVENLVFTVIGAIAGLALTWLTVFAGKSWVFSLLDDYSTIENYGLNVSLDMIFSPTLLLIVITVTLVLNLTSAMIPAVNAMRRPIVSSINEKR